MSQRSESSDLRGVRAAPGLLLVASLLVGLKTAAEVVPTTVFESTKDGNLEIYLRHNGHERRLTDNPVEIATPSCLMTVSEWCSAPIERATTTSSWYASATAS